MNELQKRFIVAFCEILYLMKCGKDVQRCEDWNLIVTVAKENDIPNWVYPAE